MFSSEHIQNKVLTITSEHPSSEDHFERKFQAKIYPSDQSDEKQEEKLIQFKGKNKQNQNMFSSENTKNEVLTITSEHESSENNFERKSQAKTSPSNQNFEQPKQEVLELKQTSPHHNTFKTKFLLSFMKLHLLNITLRPNSRPSLINMITFTNNRKKN